VYLDRAGAKSYYFDDGLGSIREMTDGTGTLQNSYSYGAWGELRVSSTTVVNSYGYTGREFSEDGFYFYRARYLDPSVGRFISEDPIRSLGMSYLYHYVQNNATNRKDPWGLKYTYNSDDEKVTGKLKGDALKLADCLDPKVGKDWIISGGSEKTGHEEGSKHYTDQAFDMWGEGHDKKKIFCAAKECGAQCIIDEGKVWHFQTVPCKNNSSMDLPRDCDCKDVK
jgi:RHS repeat-associated protein